MPTPKELRETIINAGGRLGVVSGGQTGVDRAALDAAIALGIPHGGWCPKGRTAELGETIPKRYQLVETDETEHAVRTRKNIEDSDATVVFLGPSFGSGTQLTIDHAKRTKGPDRTFILDAFEVSASEIDAAAEAIARLNVLVLNVAGPRESICPGIYNRVEPLARQLFLQILARSDRG
ncbi:putative molybdenum carrier protein [Thermostilla marina]